MLYILFVSVLFLCPCFVLFDLLMCHLRVPVIPIKTLNNTITVLSSGECCCCFFFSKFIDWDQILFFIYLNKF